MSSIIHDGDLGPDDSATWDNHGEVTIISNAANVTLRGHDINLNGHVKIRDSNTNNEYVDLDNYPINWTALHNRPFKELLNLNNAVGSGSVRTSIQNAVFGVYTILSGPSGATEHPAFAIVSAGVDGTAKRIQCYYLNDSGNLARITDMSHFDGFLDL